MFRTGRGESLARAASQGKSETYRRGRELIEHEHRASRREPASEGIAAAVGAITSCREVSFAAWSNCGRAISRCASRNERLSYRGGKSAVATGVKMSPQQFSARQMLKPPSMKGEDSTMNAPGSARSLRQGSESASASLKQEGGQPRDQLSSLETQLQSKEARLNWMLEAVGRPGHCTRSVNERLTRFP
jgi:hypothetical protein